MGDCDWRDHGHHYDAGSCVVLCWVDQPIPAPGEIRFFDCWDSWSEVDPPLLWNPWRHGEDDGLDTYACGFGEWLYAEESWRGGTGMKIVGSTIKDSINKRPIVFLFPSVIYGFNQDGKRALVFTFLWLCVAVVFG